MAQYGREHRLFVQSATDCFEQYKNPSLFVFKLLGRRFGCYNKANEEGIYELAILRDWVILVMIMGLMFD